ncbi:hypothetical protein OIU77_000272 [Salix suchowensis]|uniref:FHA domain-containing protein n=1 Tax=Salix suchowensis TaxID=1278906 RepID=A0ABQ9B700_9ROSI|nr:hypothetical protein OIU77_000272 [Salix suchowensis]
MRILHQNPPIFAKKTQANHQISPNSPPDLQFSFDITGHGFTYQFNQSSTGPALHYWPNRGNDCASEFRRKLLYCDDNGLERERINEGLSFRASLNGVFVNGVSVKKGMVRELCAGDEVLLVCGNEGNCSLGGRIGFLIKGVAFKEEVVMGLNEVRVERAWLFESIGQSQGPVSSGSGSKRVFAVRGDEIVVPDFDFLGRKCWGCC